MSIGNPTNVVEPAHLGQMFYDFGAQVFYQARGRTAADWHLVPPADMVGSFVKLYDFFVGVPADDPRGDDAEEFMADSRLVGQMLSGEGMELFSALRWRAGDGMVAMQARVRFSRTAGLSVFVGFAVAPKPHAMPGGAGFSIEDGVLTFGSHQSEVAFYEPLLLRVEVTREDVFAYVADRSVGGFKIDADASGFWLDSRPVVALFNRWPGKRPIVPGYDAVLKRSLKR